MANEVMVASPPAFEDLLRWMTGQLLQGNSLQDNLPTLLGRFGDDLGLDGVFLMTVQEAAPASWMNLAAPRFQAEVRALWHDRLMRGDWLVFPGESAPSPADEAFYSAQAMGGLVLVPFFPAEDLGFLLGAYTGVAGDGWSPRDLGGLSALANVLSLSIKRYLAEEALRRSEARFRLLAEHGSDITLILDRSAAIRYASTSVERVLDERPDQLIGRPVDELLHPADGPYFRRLVDRALGSPGMGPTIVGRFRSRDGWRVLEGVSDNMLDRQEVAGLLINFRDVSENVRAQDALRRTNYLLQAISHAQTRFIADVPPAVLFAELLHDIVCLTGSVGGHIGEWRNERLLFIADAEPAAESLRGAHTPDAVPPEGGWMPPAAPGDDRVVWCSPLRKGDTPLGVVCLQAPSCLDDEALREFLAPLLGSCANFIEAYRAQDEHRRMEARLRSAYAQLQRLNKVKDEFVATVSHELRTPLAAIKNAITIIRKPQVGPLNETQSRFVTILHEQANRLHRLVDDLLDTQAIEGGHVRYELAEADLAPVVRQVAEGFAHVLEANGLTLEVSLAAPLVARFDRDRIVQVLGNLLSNASKFTPAGGHIRVAAQASGAEIHVLVTDSGVGIAQEDQARIFQKFVRAARGTSPNTPGTGLGLAISQKLIEEGHGGQIRLTSSPGEGSTFTVVLPRPPEALKH